ncbi:hypothetical protein CO009_03865 [Candidatus Shapirobacteria bacterium CG_4_8_14_3_um_filter_35_11]|uniref:Uncharacterized protein n=1 Tax=Candidatus Shapirobacteria bacterium CG_4_8_14_3_um_filter_35_11 TaxID=1974874 RepID=A0A2M8GIR4_9BACT|nr:MAG: hypothetical protein CO009_03865 [Candidatus Shapirobacteria bacterium CG_4_8_14_3_um_filter_35_11]
MAKKTIKGVKEGCYFLGIDTRTGKVVNAEKPLPDFIARALEAQMEAIPEFFGIKPTKQETASVPEKRVKH